MAMFKRVGLFLLLNLIIMISLSIVINVLGLGNFITAKGIDLGAMAIFCLVWGMGGAFISLALSRFMAKKMMGVQVISDTNYDPRLMELKQTVHTIARQAGLTTMPEVGIYESADINAFATGPSRSRSLVAVSTGLLHNMNAKEVRGVIAHEVAHIANGDMVTMTLLQGVVNAFVMFLARLVAYAVTQFFRSDEDESPVGGLAFFATQIALEIVFMIFGSMLIAVFSRWREYRADAGAARLGGRENMIAALEALKRNMQLPPSSSPAAVQTMQIEGGRGSGLYRLFASHPSLDDRIARLRHYQAA